MSYQVITDPNYKARTPMVGERYVVPHWVSDRKAWHTAMEEVLTLLGESLPEALEPSLPPVKVTGRLPRSLPKGGSGVSRPIIVEATSHGDLVRRYVKVYATRQKMQRFDT